MPTRTQVADDRPHHRLFLGPLTSAMFALQNPEGMTSINWTGRDFVRPAILILSDYILHY